MNCADAEIMLHALIDGELDAGHARDVESPCGDLPRLRRGAQGLPRDARDNGRKRP